VDDEIDIREGLKMSLRQWGYSVRVAADYDQAIAQLEEGPPPALVIADYRLGSKTGTDVIREVRRKCGHNISALLLTGDATEERSREAARLGVQLLRKPISGEQLRRAVFDSLREQGNGR
jgi:two-component system nitrogen regulation response regulator NtrX